MQFVKPCQSIRLNQFAVKWCKNWGLLLAILKYPRKLLPLRRGYQCFAFTKFLWKPLRTSFFPSVQMALCSHRCLADWSVVCMWFLFGDGKQFNGTYEVLHLHSNSVFFEGMRALSQQRLKIDVKHVVGKRDNVKH